MSDKLNETDDNSIEIKNEREKLKKTIEEHKSESEVIEKDFIPHFFPTYRISRRFYPLPIIIQKLDSTI